jgi:putative protease
MAVSGRCLLSAFLNERSGNLGLCTNPCRFDYKVHSVVLEEEKRPGAPLWELEESDGFSRVLAADDLCLVKYLKWFCLAGINAIKIEGRTKSGPYVGLLTDIYKTALSDAMANKNRPELYMDEIKQLGSRDLSNGFLLGSPKKVVHFTEPDKPIFAQVAEQVADNKWRIQIKAKWQKGADIQIIFPGLKRPIIKANDYAIEDEKGKSIAVAHPGTYVNLYLENQDLIKDLFLRLLD